MQSLGLPRRGEDEELDFRELVDAIEAVRFATVGAGLGAEAMRQTHIFEWELVFIDHFVHVVAAKRDFRRADERKIRVLDRVDLRFRTAWLESGPEKHFITGKIGRDHRDVSFRDHEFHHPLRQSLLE